MAVRALPLILLVLGACKAPSALTRSGHYEGTVIRVISGELRKTPVAAEATVHAQGQSTLALAFLDGSPSEVITLALRDPSHLTLSVPELGLDGQVLRLDQLCYRSTGRTIVSVCPARDEIVIEAIDQASDQPIYALTLDWFPRPTPLALETPRAYALSEAIDQAFKMNFATRIEFQRVMQARHLARSTYLNLLPHLTINSILALTKFTDAAGMLGVAGDLVPFLLPSHWLHAQSVALASQAEEDALILMRADAVGQVYGLAYLLERDEKIEKDYAQSIQDTQDLLGQVRTLESLGRFPEGTADGVKTELDSMQLDLATLRLGIWEQHAHLAQALGLTNPLAISALTIDDSPVSSHNVAPVDLKPILPIVVNRSFEARQIAFLIRAADKIKTAAYYDWIDPSGDPNLALGAGLPDAVGVQAAKVAELKIQEGQLRSALLQEAANTVAELNESLVEHRLAADDLVTQEQRVQRTLEQIQFGRSATVLDLVTVFRDRLKARINLLTAEAAFKLGRAKLDRLLLQGSYSRLASEKP